MTGGLGRWKSCWRHPVGATTLVSWSAGQLGKSRGAFLSYTADTAIPYFFDISKEEFRMGLFALASERRDLLMKAFAQRGSLNATDEAQLVELVRGQATSNASMQVASDLCVKLGKEGVEAADYPGFISNRILMPMLNEAFFAVMEGVGTPEAIDAVMKGGMNHPMGPLTLADFIGLDVCLAILNVLHEGLGDPKYRPCPLLRRMVAAGHLGRKSGQGFYSYV